MIEEFYYPFIFFSVIFYFSILIISFFTKDYSGTLNDSNNSYPTYFVRNETIIESYNLDFVTNQTFLTNIQFSNNSLAYTNSYGYTGEPVRRCYIGSCYTKRD